jgi:hypothetical protein
MHSITRNRQLLPNCIVQGSNARGRLVRGLRPPLVADRAKTDDRMSPANSRHTLPNTLTPSRNGSSHGGVRPAARSAMTGARSAAAAAAELSMASSFCQR